MSDVQKSSNVKWIYIGTAVFGLIAAALVLVIRYYEIQKVKAEAEQARIAAERANPDFGRPKSTTPEVGPAPAPPGPGAGAPSASLLVGKWVRTDKEEVQIEFLPNGKMIPNETTSLSYTYATDDKGQTTIAVSDGDSGEVISCTKEELRIHWHIRHRILPDERHTVSYERFEVYDGRKTRNQWIIGVVIGVVVLGIIVAQSKKE